MSFPVKRVLVVEDSIPFRSLLRIVLESLGVDEIIEVRDGVEAIEALKTFDAELVVMDWMMTGMNGIECTRRIRASRAPNSDVPIVMVTARDAAEDIQKALEAGANAYISKPASMRRLFAGFMSAVAVPAT